MDEGQKKTVMIGVIVACIVIAGIITLASRGGGSGSVDDIPSDQMVWVKCTACQAEYQMGERDFYKQSQERLQPGMMTPTPLTCKECGKDAIRLAVKCENPSCGAIFFEGSVPGDFPDRCPKCKQSATEESRKRRKAGGQ